MSLSFPVICEEISFIVALMKGTVPLYPFSSVTQSCPTLCDPMDCMQHARLPCPSPTPGAYSKLMSIESVVPSNRLILCWPLFLLPSIFPSIRVFSSKSVLHIRWPKYWSFIFSISLSNENSGLISFRIEWLDLLALSLKFSPTSQFKSINSLALRFLQSPTLTSIHDHWKNHSLD